jgi:hypothetical protein
MATKTRSAHLEYSPRPTAGPFFRLHFRARCAISTPHRLIPHSPPAPTPASTMSMSVPDDDVDEAFLLAVDAAEAAAFDSNKRRRFSTTPSSSPTASTPPAASGPEGPYLAALKGSHSSTWQPQQTVTYTHKRPDGTKTLAGTQGASGACFKCGDPGHWARECPQSTPSTGRGGGIGGAGYADAGGEVAEKACPCGAGSCLVLTSNTPRNPGRKFYKCPMRVSAMNLLFIRTFTINYLLESYDFQLFGPTCICCNSVEVLG